MRIYFTGCYVSAKQHNLFIVLPHFKSFTNFRAKQLQTGFAISKDLLSIFLIKNITSKLNDQAYEEDSNAMLCLVHYGNCNGTNQNSYR
jgi:hypothetical protein